MFIICNWLLLYIVYLNSVCNPITSLVEESEKELFNSYPNLVLAPNANEQWCSKIPVVIGPEAYGRC